ncbi:MAG: O-antigen ligase family protein [Thermoleophilia bacterium]
MNAGPAFAPRHRAPLELRALVVIVPIALLVAVAMGYALYLFPPNGVVVLAGTVGLGGIVALVLLRYELAVALGFLLLGVVRAEPAPPDAIFAVAIAIAVVTGRFDLRRVPLAVFVLLGSFVVLNLISAIEAVSLQAAGRYMLITIYLAVFAIWLTSFVDSIGRARLVVRAYVAGAVFWAAATVAALYLPLPGGEQLLAYDATRGVGPFEDPNVYGPFLIPAALIVVEEMLTPRFLRSGGAVKLLMFCILATGVVVSFSRAAWIALVVALLVQLLTLAARHGGGRRAAAMLTVMVVAGTTVAGVLAVTDSLGFLNERASLQTYDTDRFGAQERGLQLAEQHPFGIGPGQFEIIVDIASHSTYVRALAEQGVLGFAAILALLLTTLALAARNAVLGRDTFGIGSAALLGAWTGLLINSFVVDTLHWRHLFVVAALIWAGSRRPPGQPLADETRRPRTTARPLTS